jgi:hypothetical protein
MVGISWCLIGYSPFQLRRNRQSLGNRSQSPQELLPISLWHGKPNLHTTPLRIRSAPTKKTKSLTALSRFSNHARGNTVSRKSANRLYSTPPMRNAASVASKTSNKTCLSLNLL